MSQHDYDVANGSGSSVRADLNALAGAIQSQNSGTSAPAATVSGQVWYDTTNDAMKQRNSANTDWVAQAEAIAGGHLAGHRNRIINGTMRIDQRNAGANQTITAGAALAYTIDRWYAYCTGANITGARYQPASTAPYFYRFTGAASNTGLGFGQRIEQANSIDIAGKVCTLSVKLSSTSITTVTWTAYRANSADTFGTLASPTRTQIATGTFSITSTEATYSAQFNTGSAATTGIEIVFTTGALLASQTLTIRDVQFEPGGVATPFEHRHAALELLLCKSYYQKSYEINIKPGTAASNPICMTTYATATTSSGTLNFNFPVSMRSISSVGSSTVTVYAPGSGNAGFVSLGGFGLGGELSVTVDESTSQGFRFYYSGSAVFTDGQFLVKKFHYAASAEL
jgi:hypothetical protein